jgi:hypothetical protein
MTNNAIVRARVHAHLLRVTYAQVMGAQWMGEHYVVRLTKGQRREIVLALNDALIRAHSLIERKNLAKRGERILR